MAKCSSRTLEYLQNSINTIKDLAKKANKDSNKFRVIPLAYPNVTDSSQSDQDQRLPLNGTIEQIGDDIQKIKQMEVDHIFLDTILFLFIVMYQTSLVSQGNYRNLQDKLC